MRCAYLYLVYFPSTFSQPFLSYLLYHLNFYLKTPFILNPNSPLVNICSTINFSLSLGTKTAAFGRSSRHVLRLLVLKFGPKIHLDVSFLVIVAVQSGASIKADLTCLGGGLLQVQTIIFSVFVGGWLHSHGVLICIVVIFFRRRQFHSLLMAGVFVAKVPSILSGPPIVLHLPWVCFPSGKAPLRLGRSTTDGLVPVTPREIT